MPHKTYISYKLNDALDLRDCIIKRLGSFAIYYRGERGDSPELMDNNTEATRNKVESMIDDAAVMVVIVSRNMLQSRWMEWEIAYALGSQSQGESSSRVHGIVCVVKNDDNYMSNSDLGYFSYDTYAWAKYNGDWANAKLFNIIKNNRSNRKRWDSKLSPNYIDIVTEDDFLRQPSKYIDEAFYKSQHLGCYDIFTHEPYRLW